MLYEGSRELAITVENPVDRFYVYGKNGITGTFTHEADAINLAYTTIGTVVDEKGSYIWKRTSRSTRNQIMAIKGRRSDEQSSDLAVCLETILEFAGATKNVQPLLDKNKTAKQVLEENLNDIRVLELKGVGLDAILYYVNKDIPVLATLNNGSAVLVVGFNELNIVVMDPKEGLVCLLYTSDAADD